VIAFMKGSFDILGEEDYNSKFDPIKEVYEDFKVSREYDLVGKKVHGKYYRDKLAGIQRI
jgi:hypothetical protein